MTLTHNTSGGCFLGGGADSLHDRTGRVGKVLAFHRFNVGEVVYKPTATRNLYQKRRVRSVFAQGARIIYDLGDELVNEASLITLDEYRALQNPPRRIVPRPTRKRSLLDRLGPEQIKRLR